MIEQGSPEWFAQRVAKVTASRVNDVLAKGRSGAPSLTRAAYMGELIAEALTGQPCNTFKGNADTERGAELEPAARLAYEVQTGISVRPVGFVIHPRNPRFGASPDGLIEARGGLEIKCPKPHVHLDYLLAGKAPSAYLPQMGSQAACCELDFVDFVSYCPVMPEDLQLFVVRWTPSMDYLQTIEGEVIEFLAELDAKLVQIQALRKIAAMPATVETQP